MTEIINILEQGLLFALVAMGVYITYKILDFPDLSVDGTYPLGAAICGILIANGINPWLSLLAALIGGAIAGGATAFLHVKLRITNLMSGILVMIALYSVNLRVMGKSNIPLFNTNHIFKGKIMPIIIILGIVVMVKILFDLFLKTKTGYLLVAVGDNEQVVTALGVNKNLIKVIGLMISNGLVSLAGGLTAQYQGFSEVSMGTGIVVTGLASVIIGTSIFGKLSFMKVTTLSILGSIIYKVAVAIVLKVGLNPNDLKIMTALIVVVALSANSGIFKFKNKIRKEEKIENGGVKDVEDTEFMQSI